MGLWDVDDDFEDIFDEDYIRDEGNRYLANVQDALELVSKIIPIGKSDFYKKMDMRKIDDLIDVDFLSAFKQIQLTDEAQLQMRLALLSDKLAEQKKYDVLKNRPIVGLGGKFSAGKSKFINSILKAGEELLPEDQNPTTSIPTYIVYGENEEICAYTADSQKVILDTEAMQALTHKFFEKYKMGFSSFINSLIISEPDMPYKELVFLDTPGYSKADAIGNNKKQKELTDENKAYAQLKNVDYLIWLMDIENGVLSETDIAFISKLGLDTPILIVVNKSDKKIDEDVESIVRVVEKTAKEAGLKVFGVTAYSSRYNEEWKGRNKISEFLSNAIQKKSGRDDILEQLQDIKGKVSEEINRKIEEKIEERNKLSEIIYKSESIMEIKALIDIYGKSMEEIRDMKEGRKKYQDITYKIERIMEKHYGRR